MNEEQCVAIIERYFARTEKRNTVKYEMPGSVTKDILGYTVEASGPDPKETLQRARELLNKASIEANSK